MADDKEKDVLDLALKKRLALAEALRQIDSFIATYKALKAEAPVRNVGGVPVTPMDEPRHAQLPLQHAPMSQEKAAIALLEKNGPMNVKEILASLLAQGISVGGKTPLNNLGSVLSRSERLVYDKATLTWRVRPRLNLRSRASIPSESIEGGDE